MEIEVGDKVKLREIDEGTSLDYPWLTLGAKGIVVEFRIEAERRMALVSFPRKLAAIPVDHLFCIWKLQSGGLKSLSDDRFSLTEDNEIESVYLWALHDNQKGVPVGGFFEEEFGRRVIDILNKVHDGTLTMFGGPIP